MFAALPQPLANLSVPAALLDAAGPGVVHFSPVYANDGSGQLVDLAYVRLNPTAQHLLGLPEVPAATLLTQCPGATDTFAFYRAAFLAGDLRHRQLHPAADGCDYQVQAQRHGPHLVVSLTAPLADGRPGGLVPSAAALAGGPAQQAARQLAQEHDAFRRIFTQAPAAIGLLRAPEYRFDYINPAFARLFSPVSLEGMPAAQVLPEALNQGFMTLLDRVYETGETVLEAEVRLPTDAPGPTRYFNFTFQAHLPEHQAEADRHADRLSMFAFDVTEQVVARQQVQRLNHELQAANEELRANNAELARAQRQLQQLNQELECRVAAGVRTAQEAQAEAEGQRQRLTRFFQQAPVAICVLTGPDLVYELVNPMYQQRFAGRELLGQPVRSIPELQATDIPDMLHAVYQTGVPHEGHEVRLPQLTRADGHQREDAYFNCLYQPRYDEHGRIDGVLAFAFDVTEQVKARQLALRLNQELEHRVAERTAQLRATHAQASNQHRRLQDFIRYAPVAISHIEGPQLRLMAINPAACQVWSCTQDELLGRPLLEALPQLQGTGFEELLLEAMRTQVPFVGQEMAVPVLRQGQPGTGYFNLVYQPLPAGPSGEPGILTVAVEVTAQVLAHRQLQQHNQELEARLTQCAAQLRAALHKAG